MEPSILETTSAGVLTLTLNRPTRRNALDSATAVALHQRLVAASADAGVRTVVLTGTGGAFCSGADLKEAATAPPDFDVIERAYNPTVRVMRRMPKPIIAAVDGIATGIGASLALAADIRLASARARFSFIFVRIGLGLDGGASWLLPRIAGRRAFELAMTGELIAAEEAERVGIVNHVYPDELFATEVRAFAARLAAGAPLALAAIKATLNASLGLGLDQALEDERMAQARLILSRDFQEGVAAFMGKRVADFRGE